MQYYTLLKEIEVEYVERESVFRGYAARVENEQEAREFVSAVMSRNSGADHFPYGFIMGADSQVKRFDDGGEPGGTAGVPIMETIYKNNLTYAAVVVCRYSKGALFGGSSLIRAYNHVASLTVEAAGKVRKVMGAELTFEVPAGIYEEVKRKLLWENISVYDEKAAEKVSFKINAEEKKVENTIELVKEYSAGEVVLQAGVSEMFFVYEGRLVRNI